jgi:hypothetical protein
VALNLCDGTGEGRDGVPGVEVIDALERRRIPYTGARAEPYSISCDKVAMLERIPPAISLPDQVNPFNCGTFAA